jgi:hypothetical protein
LHPDSISGISTLLTHELAVVKILRLFWPAREEKEAGMLMRKFRLSWNHTDGHPHAVGTIDEWDYEQEEFEASSDEEAIAIASDIWKRVTSNVAVRNHKGEEQYCKPRKEFLALVELTRDLGWKPAP